MKKIFLLFSISVLAVLSNVDAQVNLLTQSFDATTFPPTAGGTWTRAHVSGGASTDIWKRATAATGAVNASLFGSINPGPHTGSGMAWFNCFNYSSGSTSDLSTPALNFSLAASGTYKVSFWMYRADGWGLGVDQMSVYVNTSATATGGTLLATINQDISETPTVASEGWYQYTFNIPASFSTTTNYIIFRAVSDYWDDILLDDVSVDYYCSLSTTASNSGPVCPGSNITLTGVSTGTTYSWTGPSGFSSTLLSPVTPAVAGTYTLVASTATCTNTATTTVSLLAAPPVPVVLPSVATICNGGSVTLTATVPLAPGTILSQNFNGTVAPWTIDNTGMVGAVAESPWQLRPNGYTYAGLLSYTFNSPDASQFAITISDAGGIGSTTSSKLISPAFSLVGYSTITLSFQHAYQPYTTDRASVDISTDGGTTWTILNDYGAAGAYVGTSTSFATATFSLAAYAGQPNCKLRFYYNSSWNWWWALDNVTVTGVPTTAAVPVWTPATNLFTNATFSTPYVTGTPVNTVYVHPTTVSTSTVVNYIASVTTGGCTSSDTSVVTINPGVPAITGTTSVCTGSQITLSNTSLGGTWTSANTSIATVNPLTGVVTGVSAGTDTIYYSVTGCSNFIIITVGTGLTPITGPVNVCFGGTVTLNNATSGGTWTSSAPGVASVNSATGVVSGVTVGSAIITYTAAISGCSDTAMMTVIADPNPITGSMIVCYGGGTTTLSETTLGGNWSSGNTSIATVDAGGVVYGVSGGTVIISYIMPSGCYVTANVVVNAPLPAITGPSAVCAGATISLANTTSGGSWTSGTTAAATISGTGVVGGVATGSSIITYSTSVGCNAYKTITVNPLPSAITGPSAVCAGGATISLSDISGTGSWTSSGPSGIATITSGGVVTGVASGSVTITYTLPVTGCYTTTSITVNPLPAAITGASAVCENGATVTVADATGTGSWSAAPAVTLAVDATGTITGTTAGAGMVTYTLPVTGCYVTRAITVNPVPAAITGTPVVCLNASVTLTNATGTGAWTSSNTAIVTIDAASGYMTGLSVGSANIVYTLPVTGCYTTVTATVNPLPAPIGAVTSTVCSGGATIALTETSGPGTWTSGDNSIATVGSSSGIVTGVASGTVPVTFTITSSSCFATTNITVNPIPTAISGASSVCEGGSVITLSDATTPGTWSITPAGTASISAAGVVTGGSAGSATVTYTGANGCYVTTGVTVNPLPAPITGVFSVCQLSVTTLSSTSIGGTWLTGLTSIATVNAGGGVYGVSSGVTPVTYTLPTGCRTIASVTVNAIPSAITGSSSICFNGIGTLSNTVGGGVWSSSNSAIASVESSTGIVHGIAVGSAVITYTTGTNGCYATQPVSITGIVIPTVTLGITPSTTVCAGTAVTYSATITNGGAAPLYVWSVNNMILSGASSYSYTPADGDQVRCWIISSYACASPDTASSWVNMTVHPIVTPSLGLSIVGGDTVCLGSPAVVNTVPVAGGTAPVYTWTKNLIPVTAGAFYSYTPANGDVITCTMTSNAFCQTAATASATKIITVSPYVTPSVTMNSMLGLTTCDGYPDVFTTTEINGGTVPTYQWTVNGSNVGTGSAYTYAPVNGDNVQVTMTSNFPCVTTPIATANMSMTVLPITQPVGIVSAVPGYIVAPGMYDTFTVNVLSGGGLAPTYQWYKNSIPVPGQTNTVYITNSLNNGDSVSCEVVNTDQCSGVTVFNYVNITVGYNVGVHQVNKAGSTVVIVPNPNNGLFTVKATLGVLTDEDVNMEITDMLGQIVYRNTARAVNGELNEQIRLSGLLANGSYILNVNSEHISKVFHFVLAQ